LITAEYLPLAKETGIIGEPFILWTGVYRLWWEWQGAATLLDRRAGVLSVEFAFLGIVLFLLDRASHDMKVFQNLKSIGFRHRLREGLSADGGAGTHHVEHGVGTCQFVLDYLKHFISFFDSIEPIVQVSFGLATNTRPEGWSIVRAPP
jgi:hypothetical protein